MVCAATSSPVSTPSTPGSFSAAATSIDWIRAWACGLRNIAQCTMPGRLMLSMNSARPVTGIGSSTRLTAFPMSRASLVGSSAMNLRFSTAMIYLAPRSGGSASAAASARVVDSSIAPFDVGGTRFIEHAARANAPRT